MPDLVRFGNFELDLETADLRSGGRSVRLPEQQFLILQMLLLRDGGVVSREEIRKKLWPNDTVVEFDRSINTAIMKLRIALGDTADQPGFIETLARRGYRLIVAVEPVKSEPSQPPAQRPAPSSMTGRKVSHYRVLGILGGGGMGLVYKGEDLKLNRPVAMKFLPEELAADPVTLQRFEREARTASLLNHPNICTIYEVEEFESQPFIVMELLEGDTLREVIARNVASSASGQAGIPLARLRDIASQVAEGLNAAHEKGIIHRDIKPANIFVSPAGRVKILDFGLAKMADLAPGTQGISGPFESPVQMHGESPADLNLSRTGITLGTAGYMSPEQVRGEKLDARTDLFSFGLILFEMATGQRAVTGETAEEVQSAILNRELPPVRTLNPNLPLSLEKIIIKALEKDREKRYASAAEMLEDFSRIAVPKEAATTVAEAKVDEPLEREELHILPRRRGVLAWWIGAFSVMALATVAYFTLSSRSSSNPLRIVEYKQLTHDGHAPWVLGTDGNRLFLEKGVQKPIGQVAVAGGEIVPLPINVTNPWLDDISPDGSTLLVESYEHGGTTRPLYSVPLLGGSRRLLANVDSTNFAGYTPDGNSVIYGLPDRNTYIMRSDGSDSHKFASIEKPRHLAWSPDGTKIRFTKDNRIWEMSSDFTDAHPLLPGWRTDYFQCCGRWSQDGRFFFFLSGPGRQIWVRDEWKSPFSRSSSTPVQLTSGPIAWGSPVPAKDGKAVFTDGSTTRGELVRFESKSNQLQPFLGGISAEQVSFSKDGRSVAYVSFPDGTLWKANSDGSEPSQLTEPPLTGVDSAWSPDGTQIVFTAYLKGRTAEDYVYIVSSRGGAPHRLLPEDKEQEISPNWAPDGSKIIFTSIGSSKNEIRILDIRSRQVTTLPGSSSMEVASWSPDGRFIKTGAHDTDKIYLFNLKSQQWSTIYNGPLSNNPAWSKDSRFVFVLRYASDPAVLRIPITGGNAQVVVNLKGFRCTGTNGGWMGLDPSDVPMLLRDVGTDDIYALRLQEQ